MATLEQIYRIRTTTTGLLHRTAAACMVAAGNIVNEAAGTPNHANRLTWANQALQDPESKAREMMREVALNASVQTTYDPGAPDEGVDDGAIQFITNSSIDLYAKGA